MATLTCLGAARFLLFISGRNSETKASGRINVSMQSATADVEGVFRNERLAAWRRRGLAEVILRQFSALAKR
jgi:hypothetical protein